MTSRVELDLELPNGPRPVARGWYAQAYDGAVYEVVAFGGGGGPFVWVDVDSGRIVMSGSGDYVTSGLSATKAEAIEKILESAVEELTRARAAVDRLRGALASARLE